MTSFASQLAQRLQAHERFWIDYGGIRRLGALQSLAVANHVVEGMEDGAIERLIYSASIFVQAENDESLSLAQSIALSALLVSDRPAVHDSAMSILAQAGNFPSLSFVRQNIAQHESPPINELQLHLLQTLNTVKGVNADTALTDFQLNVWRALAEFHTLSISAPTSAGKSFVVIEHLCKTIIEKHTFMGIYIAPTRALLGEIFRKLSDKLAEVEGLRISTVPALDPQNNPKQLYVLTQERLSALLAVSDVRPEIVVVDEAQNIGDGARGMILQDCIERIRENMPSVQVVLLSPGAVGFPVAMRTLGIADLSSEETILSPVLQNRILVHTVQGSPRTLQLALLEKDRRISLGELSMGRGFENAANRLAAVALEFGKEGASLVYATGPAESEKIASQLVLGLDKKPNHSLSELSEFIKTHIHGEYGLAEMALYGVAFHYGKMPALLRESIERAFQEGHIRYLVCTTTLFQGINLPARNVFINTPTRGRGVKLDPALLWNFAGRAGRLSKDVVGNVFLVDYDSWIEQSLERPARVVVTPSFSATVTDHVDAISEGLAGNLPKEKRGDEVPAQIRAATGYLLARASKGTLKTALSRLPDLLEADRARLNQAALSALGSLELSRSIVENNWTVNLFGLARLQATLKERVADGTIEEFIPCAPSEKNAFRTYVKIFNLVATTVLEYNVTTFGAFVANYALQWMQGTPYPVIIRKWITFRRKNTNKPIDPIIREAFDFIEEELRFKWVQLGKAYVSVLDQVLEVSGRSELKARVFDFSLALELGVSTTTGRSFVELGLSRIAATTLESLYPDSELTADQARTALKSLNLTIHRISPVIVRELLDLELIDNSK